MDLKNSSTSTFLKINQVKFLIKNFKFDHSAFQNSGHAENLNQSTKKMIPP